MATGDIYWAGHSSSPTAWDIGISFEHVESTNTYWKFKIKTWYRSSSGWFGAVSWSYSAICGTSLDAHNLVNRVFDHEEDVQSSGWNEVCIDTSPEITAYRNHTRQTLYAKAEGTNDYSGWESWVSAYVGTHVARATDFIDAKPSYPVNFEANGGKDAPEAQAKWYDENLTLQTSTPTRTGYTFTGWNTKADGTGTSYAAGGTYSANAALTLYAQWSLDGYQVTYNAYTPEGAGAISGIPQAQLKQQGQALTLSSATPTLFLYAFKGWATSLANAAAGIVSYLPGDTYMSDSALSLYTVWEIAYIFPTITNVKINRCSNTGVIGDEYEDGRFQFDWALGDVPSTGTLSSLQVGYRHREYPNIDPGPYTWITIPGISGRSGSVDWHTTTAEGQDAPFDRELTWEIQIKLTDSSAAAQGSGIDPVTYDYNMPLAIFTIHAGAGGNRLGFGCAAPDDEEMEDYPSGVARFNFPIELLNGIIGANGIIDHGSLSVANVSQSYNGTWYWQKWESGLLTMICRMKVDSIEMDNLYGSLYWSDSMSFHYPQWDSQALDNPPPDFIRVPHCVILNCGSTDANITGIEIGSGASLTDSPSFVCWRPDSATANNVMLLIAVFGSWRIY